MSKLTPEEIKKATKKARKGLILGDNTFIQAMRNANRADEFKPLLGSLTEDKRKQLIKGLRGGKMK